MSDLHTWLKKEGLLDPGFYAASGGYITYRTVRLRFDTVTRGGRALEKIPLREALQIAGLLEEFESGSTPAICPLEI